MDEAERCDLLMFLLDGKLIAQDTPHALKSGIAAAQGREPTLDDVFVYLTNRSEREEG